MLRYITLLLSLMLTCGIAYTQHPVGYRAIESNSQVGVFSIDSLDRQIVRQRTATFHADAPLVLTFDILVMPEGNVKYVRSPRMKPELSQVRLACTSALYDFIFETIDTSLGERWFKVKMVTEPE